VFARWDGVDRGGIATDGDLLARALAGRNDLQPSALAIAPVIAEVLALLDAAAGRRLVRMSGSGATCFALFDSIDGRDAAAERASARGWWTLATTLT
jgi:4-diphosphocytidyl-2-C-methyl-D-erythritol kinase